MVALDTHPPLSLRKGLFVEVSCDDEGFRGAWFRATILGSPPNPASKTRRKALVQYHNLLTDDGSKPLTEYVDPDHIRPLPPPPPGAHPDLFFEEGQVVDAFYNDAWWTGVVRRVLDDSKYLVYFDTPPDVIEFHRQYLRFHQDWLGGKWLLAPKQKQQSPESFFTSGRSVEVNIGIERLHDVWFPATVIKELDGEFLVKYKSSRNGDEAGFQKAIVDLLHIRPLPPSYSDKCYELLEKVDAIYDSGWRVGLITKVLAGRKYEVFFKSSNDVKELGHSELRPHMEWTNGKWVTESKEVLVASANQEQLGHGDNVTDKSQVTTKLGSSFSIRNIVEEKTPCLGTGNNLMQKGHKKIKLSSAEDNATLSLSEGQMKNGRSAASPMPIPTVCSREMTHRKSSKDKSTTKTEDTKSRNHRLKKICVSTQPSPQTESPLVGKKAKTKRAEVVEQDSSVVSYRRKGKPIILSTKKSRALLQGLEAEITGGNQAANSCEPSGQEKDMDNHVMQKSTEASKQNGGNSQKRKRGRPRKFDTAPVTPVTDALSKEATEVPQTDSTAREVKPATVGLSNSVDDDKPLSMWIGGSCSRMTIDQHTKTNSEVATDPYSNNANSDCCLDKSQNWPFVKCSPVWETIESMEVFKMMPQEPHFQPLRELKEECREGNAIGMMVTFSGYVGKISKLRFEDPTSTFNDILEGLLDLEKHGFDVNALRGRVIKLLSIKDRQSQLHGEAKGVEKTITELTQDKMRFDAALDEIEKKIAELQENIVLVKSRKEAADLEISRLQSHVDGISTKIRDAELDFRKVVAASWE